MEEHARRVQHRPQERASAAFDARACVAHDGVDVDRAPPAIDVRAASRASRAASTNSGWGRPESAADDPVDRGKGAPGVHRPTYNTEVKVRAKSRREQWG